MKFRNATKDLSPKPEYQKTEERGFLKEKEKIKLQ